MQTNEPEKWAVELLARLDEAGRNAMYATAESREEILQRAFEDQARKLREKLSRYERGAGPDDWRGCPGQCGESCCGYHEVCRQVLKEAPDDQ